MTGQAGFAEAAKGTGLLPVASLPKFDGAVLKEVPGGFGGPAAGGVTLIARQFDSQWRLQAGGHQLHPVRSFGWATQFPDTQPGKVHVTYAGQPTRDAVVAVLAVLWFAALWITRKPVRR